MMNQTGTPASLHDRFALPALLNGVHLAALEQALQVLVGSPLCLVDASAHVVFGQEQPPSSRAAAVLLEGQSVGELRSAAASAEHLDAAARLLDMVLTSRALYLIASDLQGQATRTDSDELTHRQRALEEAEARYAELKEQHDLRIQHHADIIEDKQLQIYQAEKLASIGRLAAGVAHEINNPIGFIHSNLVTSQSYIDKLKQIDELIVQGQLAAIPDAWRRHEMGFLLNDFSDLLAECIDGVDRVAHVVRDLKGFSNVDRPDEEVVDLNDNLRSVCSVISGQLPVGVRLMQDLNPLPKLLCLPGHLNQVFSNILQNALQAVGQNGEIRVTSDTKDGAIRVRIADTGHGIAPEVLTRVFDPFFTTQDVGAGTGLGLTVARDIVRAHGGRIEADSTRGAGSMFTVHLPA